MGKPFPALPDAAVWVVSALPSKDALAARASCSSAANAGAEAFAGMRRLVLPHVVQGLPAREAPRYFHGIRELVLEQGILKESGLFSDLADELAAAVELAHRLPNVARIDLSRHKCTILLGARTASATSELAGASADRPPFGNCFALAAGGGCGKGGDLLSEATVWARLLRAEVKSRQGDEMSTYLPHGKKERVKLAAKIPLVRAGACAAVPALATTFVAHVVDSEADITAMLEDLRHFVHIQDLSIVLWPAELLHSATWPRTLQRRTAGSERSKKFCIRELLPQYPSLTLLSRRFVDRYDERGTRIFWQEECEGCEASKVSPASSREHPSQGRTQRAGGHNGSLRHNAERNASRSMASRSSRPSSTLRGSSFAGFGNAGALWGYVSTHS